MQTQGGYRYPSDRILAVLSFIVMVVTITIHCTKHHSLSKSFLLFLNLEGTVLLASALTPSGLLEPQGKLIKRILWWFKPQKGAVALYFHPGMFYGGLFLLSVAQMLSVILT